MQGTHPPDLPWTYLNPSVQGCIVFYNFKCRPAWIELLIFASFYQIALSDFISTILLVSHFRNKQLKIYQTHQYNKLGGVVLQLE